MISSDFGHIIEMSQSDTRLTAIVSILRISKVEQYKHLLMALLGRLPSARVNPLYGFPEMIVDADSAAWQSLIKEHPDLLNGPDIIVNANHTIFCAPPGKV
jgi:hypothetical protein